ncbi:MAG: MaoC family dehydratase [Chloroflexota bacterium]
MNIQPHQRFKKEIFLTPEITSSFAKAAGDLNPIHHDPEFAATTRFGRLIASGTHTSALLMGLTANHFSTFGAMVGLEFSLYFKKPVFADETIVLEWLIVDTKPHKRTQGLIVDLRGRIQNSEGITSVGAKGKVLVAETL